MSEKSEYKGPFIYGGSDALEAARQYGYPEHMLRLTKPIPLESEPVFIPTPTEKDSGDGRA